MATNTSYLGLTKPAQSDLYNIDVFNGNADAVDTNAQKTAANLATIEAVATASKPYVVGEYLVLNGILYKVTQAIANGGALVVGTNIAQDNVGTELKSIKESLTTAVSYTSIPANSSRTIDFSNHHHCAVIGGYGASTAFVLSAYSNRAVFVATTGSITLTATCSSNVLTISNSGGGSYTCTVIVS